MVVDEFQDTSPLQLQLFTKFAELVDKVVWVGDSKQAIYEFRGTDPELMKAVAAHIQRRLSSRVLAVQGSRHRPLQRDQPRHVPGAERGRSRLAVPKARRDASHAKSALGGSREAWTLAAKTVPEQRRAVATGVVDLIQRRGFKGSDVAVLAHSNDCRGGNCRGTGGARSRRQPPTPPRCSPHRKSSWSAPGWPSSRPTTTPWPWLSWAHLHPDHPQFGRWVPALFDAEEPDDRAPALGRRPAGVRLG